MVRLQELTTSPTTFFIGRHDPLKLQSWFTPEVWGKFPGYPALITSEYAVVTARATS